jgi:hypothetical protein
MQLIAIFLLAALLAYLDAFKESLKDEFDIMNIELSEVLFHLMFSTAKFSAFVNEASSFPPLSLIFESNASIEIRLLAGDSIERRGVLLL